MDLWWKWRSVVVALLLSLSLAGCTEDAPEQSSEQSETGDTTGADGAAPGTDDVAPAETEGADLETALFAPTWSIGDRWTYQASGVWHPEATVALQVVEVAGDQYLLGSDSDVELAFSYAREGPFISYAEGQGIDQDTLGVYMHDTVQDLFGFARADGASWDIKLFNIPFKLTKTEADDVQGPNGEGRGLRISSDPEADVLLNVVYSVSAGWFTLFEIVTKDGDPLLRYTLESFGKTEPITTKRWSIGTNMHVDADPPFDVFEQAQMTSSGSAGGLHYVLAIITDGGTVGAEDARQPAPVHAGAVLTAPDGSTPVQETRDANGEEWMMGPVDDQAGDWTFSTYAYTQGRAKVFAWLFEVTEA